MNLSQADIKAARFDDGYDCPIFRLLSRNGFAVDMVFGSSWRDKAGCVYPFSPTFQKLSLDLARETDAASNENRPVDFSQFIGRKVSL